MIDAPHDPGTQLASERATLVHRERVPQLVTPGGSRILVGIASWTDASMTAPGVFYPDAATTPEARLRYYAGRFPLVEVDSTYYALPSRRMANLWVERTPESFTFNVKAHALMTGQPSEVSRLPKELRAALPASLANKVRVYASELPPEVRDAVWEQFLDALVPLRQAGRLGAILLQYPRWVVPSRSNAELIATARNRLAGWKAAVELRNKTWFDDRTRERTFELLRHNALSFVCVDSPPGFESSVPAMAEATTHALSVVRFHGRNTDNWEARVARVSQRFRYLYDEMQLTEWVPRIRSLTEQAEEVHLVFNNCYGNYATTNALEMTALLAREQVASAS